MTPSNSFMMPWSRSTFARSPSAGTTPHDFYKWSTNMAATRQRVVLHQVALPVVKLGAQFGERALGVLRTSFGDRVRATSTLEVEVRVDDESFTPTPDAPLLARGDLSWLEEFVALALELRSSAFTHLTESVLNTALRRLRQIRIRIAASVSFCLNGEEALQLNEAGRTVGVRHDLYPTIVAQMERPGVVYHFNP